MNVVDDEVPPRPKPPQHKSVREVAHEEMLPMEARMKGMEDWLTGNSTKVRAELVRQQEELNDIRSQIIAARTWAGVPLRFTVPWWVRAWWWVRRKVGR